MVRKEEGELWKGRCGDFKNTGNVLVLKTDSCLFNCPSTHTLLYVYFIFKSCLHLLCFCLSPPCRSTTSVSATH